MIYAALMNPYPYPAADRIVRLTVNSKAGSGDWINLNGPQIGQLQQLRSVEAVLAMDYDAMNITGPDVPENVNTIGLISNGFSELGAPPLLGRGLLPSDAPEGQEPQPVVVLSYKFWQKHFFGNRAVLGKILQLDRKNYVIIGVAAPRFTWYSADVFLPLKLMQNQDHLYMVNIVLKRGVTRDAANAELQPVMERFAQAMPKQFPEHFKVNVEGLNDWVVKSIGGTLYLLFGAVGLLLAIGAEMFPCCCWPAALRGARARRTGSDWREPAADCATVAHRVVTAGNCGGSPWGGPGIWNSRRHTSASTPVCLCARSGHSRQHPGATVQHCRGAGHRNSFRPVARIAAITVTVEPHGTVGYAARRR